MVETSAWACRRDRLVVMAGIVILSLLSWAYMFVLATPNTTGDELERVVMHPMMTAWDVGLLMLSMIMWSVMMIAMMLPTATPMLLSFARLQHQRRKRPEAIRMTGWFSAGYLAAWIVFGVLAATAQWVLYSSNLMTSAMGQATPILAGALLIAAGVFQWTGLKSACLTRCQSPLNFLLNEWRPGSHGALMMGLRHGVFCVGCCWALMLLMFVGGVMNLVWMAAIALYMLVEKIIPPLRGLGTLTGAPLVLAGVVTLGISISQ